MFHNPSHLVGPTPHSDSTQNLPMAQPEFLGRQQALHTPPVLPRNPLRDRFSRQELPRRNQANCGEHVIDVPSLTARRHVGEACRELADMQQDPVTAVYVSTDNSLILWKSNSSRHMAQAPCDEDKASQASTGSSLNDGFTQYSSHLQQGKSFAPLSSDDKSSKQCEIEEAMARIRGNGELSESLRDGSAYNVNPGEWKGKQEQEEARLEAWLERGSVGTLASLSESPLQPSTTRSFSPWAQTYHALTKSSPISPTASDAPITGRRAYASPGTALSPLNNGRDAYGNYIPTNTRDYFITQSPPTSPTLQSIREEDALQQTPMPYLRGGGGDGGWWNSLGIGQRQTKKEPSLQLNTPGTKSSYHNTPLQTLNKTSSPREQDFSSDSQAQNKRWPVDRAFGDASASTKSRRVTADADGGADESDHEVFEAESSLPPAQQFQRIANTHFGSVQHRRRGRSVEPYSPTPDQRTTVDDFSYGEISPEAPCSDISYGAREHKRWNREPTHGPPSACAVPPPPSSDTLLISDALSSLSAPLSLRKYRYRGAPSVAESFEAWELQSLQFGESVSVTGQRSQNSSRWQTNNTSSDALEASQKRAQIEFRPLCQDIMTRYNAEISGHERARQRNEITPEQYIMVVEWNASNRENSLKHSAERCGYSVRVQPFSVSVTIKKIYTRD
jgi:hypothetical protein